MGRQVPVRGMVGWCLGEIVVQTESVMIGTPNSQEAPQVDEFDTSRNLRRQPALIAVNRRGILPIHGYRISRELPIEVARNHFRQKIGDRFAIDFEVVPTPIMPPSISSGFSIDQIDLEALKFYSDAVKPYWDMVDAKDEQPFFLYIGDSGTVYGYHVPRRKLFEV